MPTWRRRRTSRCLRFLTCGSVDDGKSTLIGRLLYDSKLIFEDQLAALDEGFQEARHHGRRHRFRAAGRRARGRARAGHHHRRRLSLLRHREAQIHRRRHAGPRAIHAQHGDRRLEFRARRHPGRCAQGRADPDAAPCLYRLAAAASAMSCLPSTRSIWSDFSQDIFDTIEAEFRRFRGEARLRDADGHPDVGALWRQRHRKQPKACPGTRVRRC